WGECAELAERHPEVDVDPDVLYIDDGDVLTAAGSAASIDLCLHLVALDFGASAAGEIARDLVVPPHRDGGQAQYIRTPIPDLDSDHLFAETLVWLRANAAEPVSVAELARRSGMSARTFARRFLETTGSTPYQWLLRERVRLAQGLLESGTESIDAIAAASGFGTATNLRKHFARTVATSPTAYRRTFHGSPRPGRGEDRAS
ncbi:MAG: helix-turn-helix domain-containing protein, partial [Actinobacteria bacterium]|nr:helix-turn-helix domain-containing protein [Actinomycetota bacterium]